MLLNLNAVMSVMFNVPAAVASTVSPFRFSVRSHTKAVCSADRCLSHCAQTHQVHKYQCRSVVCCLFSSTLISLDVRYSGATTSASGNPTFRAAQNARQVTTIGSMRGTGVHVQVCHLLVMPMIA